VEGLAGGHVPEVEPETARRLFTGLHKAIRSGFVRACHDLSEGGLAVSIAEMAFAGGLGATLRLEDVPGEIRDHHPPADQAAVLLFSESHSRFLCEVPQRHRCDFERAMAGVYAHIGEVTDGNRLQIAGLNGGNTSAELLIDLPLDQMKEAWQRPLRW
jgi:phosphoribosylformylglycinamidine (FGAM) synthase-like enzyme